MRNISLALLAGLLLAGGGGCRCLKGMLWPGSAYHCQGCGGCDSCGIGGAEGVPSDYAMTEHGSPDYAMAEHGSHGGDGCVACRAGNGHAARRALRGPGEMGPPGPPTGAVTYPYYTTRAPRDFLMSNPPGIGP